LAKNSIGSGDFWRNRLKTVFLANNSFLVIGKLSNGYCVRFGETNWRFLR